MKTQTLNIARPVLLNRIKTSDILLALELENETRFIQYIDYLKASKDFNNLGDEVGIIKAIKSILKCVSSFSKNSIDKDKYAFAIDLSKTDITSYGIVFSPTLYIGLPIVEYIYPNTRISIIDNFGDVYFTTYNTNAVFADRKLADDALHIISLIQKYGFYKEEITNEK